LPSIRKVNAPCRPILSLVPKCITERKVPDLGVRLLREGMHWIRVHVCKRVCVRIGVQHVRKRPLVLARRASSYIQLIKKSN